MIKVQDKKLTFLEHQSGMFNLAILGACVFLIIFYIVQMNQFISHQYRTEVLRERLKSMVQEQNKIQLSKFQYDGIPQIDRFARSQGMVEAGNILYIFEERSVAQK